MANKDSDDGLGVYAGEIMRNEGFFGFYKGFNTNVIRAMVLNATKMAVYDTCKGFLINAFALEGLFLQFCAAFVSGSAGGNGEHARHGSPVLIEEVAAAAIFR